MATSDSGFNSTAANQAITDVISGGATVHLFGGGSTLSYTDGSTEITNKSEATVSVAEADFTITAAASYSGTTTLENDNELDFGSQDIGIIDDVVIQNDANPNRAIRANEPNNPDTTGENVTIAAGTILYEIGNA
jgi:hypothetical protein